jgi:ATP-dependent DNA helicase RecQ
VRTLQGTARSSEAGDAGDSARRLVEEAAGRLGIEALRPEQEQVIAESLAARDALMVVPTGFGKSACYQIPSMLLPKPVVMVSPLLSLLQDQQQKLLARDIPCVRLDGSVRGRARREAMERIGRDDSLLIMTTPETLAGEELSELLRRTGVGLVAVDEAHCISEWGYDFRPAYRRIGAQLRALGAPPLLALTATATEHVREAIVQSLGMRDPSIVAVSPHRSNLAFEVLRCEGDVRARVLLRLVRRLRRPGIIYCSTRREVDMVYVLLRRFRVPAHRYHGGMTSAERDQEQTRFMRRGHRTVMVATNAFGLGIDKHDIRYVMHYQSPASLEQYVQEAGRGGRDGKKANCILLHDPADRRIHEALLARSRIRPEQLFKLGSALAAWSDEQRSPSLEALALSAELGPRITSALLAKLEEAGFVHVEGESIHVTDPSRSIEEDTRSLAGQFERLRREDSRRLDTLDEYASSTECRAVFLQRYFGEADEEPCGLCDVCRGLPKRPTGFFAPLAPPKQPERKQRPRRGGRGRSRGRSRSRSRPRSRPAAGQARDASATSDSAPPQGTEPRSGTRRRSRSRRRRRPRRPTPDA